jgi:hypothetical protein
MAPESPVADVVTKGGSPMELRQGATAPRQLTAEELDVVVGGLNTMFGKEPDPHSDIF